MNYDTTTNWETLASRNHNKGVKKMTKSIQKAQYKIVGEE